MEIYNLRKIKDILRFAVRTTHGELNALSQCNRCPLSANGCRNNINLQTGSVEASLDLSNRIVYYNVVKNNFDTPCGISEEVRYRVTPKI